MQKYRKLIPIVTVVLLAFGINLDRFGIDLDALMGGTSSQEFNTEQSIESTPAGKNSTLSTGVSQTKRSHWSNTKPEINLWHVFDGEINRKGKPTGYHSRPGGQDPENARVTSIKDRPNKLGVYTANIEVRDGNRWKSKFSSFFPDELSQQQVVDAILHAYSNSKNPKKQPWSGPSGLGFQIQGYTSSRGGINTAFPIYNRKQ